MFKRIRTKIRSSRPKKITNPRLHKPRYINIHRGKDFLIFGTGPSVERYKKEITRFIDKTAPVTIGCNNIPRLYRLDYYGVTNRKRFIENARFIKGQMQVLISPYIAKWVVREHFKGKYWTLMYVNSSRHDFGVSKGVLLSSCGTSTLVLVGLAVIMGAGNIYIAGLDGYSEYFSNREKINCLDVKTKHSSFKEDRRHYLRLQRLNERSLKEIDSYFFAKRGRHLKIITPTVHNEYYDGAMLR